MEKSVPVQVRISLENLATITKFIRSNGDSSNTAGRIVSAGVKIFAEMLKWNRLSSEFDFNQAVDLLEREGLFGSIRVNKKEFAKKVGRIRINGLPPNTSQQEFSEILKKFEELQSGQLQECKSDLSIPAGAEQVLAELESGLAAGKIPVVEDE